MPAAKPADLIERHETAAETAQRAQAEASMRPRSGLQKTPPAALKDKAVAQREWRRAMNLYGQLEAEIVTALDYSILLQYCILCDQLAEMDALRQGLMDEDEKDIDAIVKLDARLDRKRALLHSMQQSLYLTPRARAGTAPKKKEKEPEKDPLELLLDEVTDYMNGGA
jgi:hypothetical protein